VAPTSPNLRFPSSHCNWLWRGRCRALERKTEGRAASGFYFEGKSPGSSIPENITEVLGGEMRRRETPPSFSLKSHGGALRRNKTTEEVPQGGSPTSVYYPAGLSEGARRSSNAASLVLSGKKGNRRRAKSQVG